MNQMSIGAFKYWLRIHGFHLNQFGTGEKWNQSKIQKIKAMKRQIKFRGKRVDTGEWVIGCLVGYHQAYYDGNSNRVCICSGILTTTEVISDTVGQFTGLLDKNGKEIYEGDILGFEIKKDFFRDANKFVLSSVQQTLF